MYELIELFKEGEKIFIRVRFKGYDIGKWYDPEIPEHVDEIEILSGKDKGAIDQIVQALGDELVVSLKHPDVDVLDENNEVKQKLEKVEKPEKVDLLDDLKKIK